jgi:DNA repair photolyase
MLPTVPAKTILSGYQEKGGWFGAQYNMNIYRGCSHGCIYCDSRSECYRIEDFDRVRAKENALTILARELPAKRKKGIVMTGAMSDPYNPWEATMQLTWGALKLIQKNHFGVAINTKSSLVTRDIHLLQEIMQHAPVNIGITITCAEDALAEKIEPRVAKSSERFAAIKALAAAGIYTGVLLMPVLPFINDTEENIIGIVEAAHKAGARYIYTYGGFGVTLRDRQRTHFFEALHRDFPGIKEQYIRVFGNTYSC